MKKSLLIALGLAMFSASVYAQPATTAKAFRMYNDPTSSVTITAGAALGNGVFTWPQPATGIFKTTAGGIMSISAVNLNSADITGTLQVANGGTGLTTVPANGLLIGNGTSPLTVLTTSANKMLVTDGAGNISWGTFPPSIPFSSITTGTNSAAAMTVNNGASIVLGTAGAIIEANRFIAGGATNAVDLNSAEVAGTLPLARGGTNQTGAAVNGAVVYSDADSYEYTTVGSANQVLISNGAAAPTWSNVNSVITGSALTKTDDANVTITLGGTPATALLQPASITLGWSGLLSIARGGTNSTAAPTAGAVAYGTGSAYNFTAAGSSGQFLQSTGASAPVWTSGAIATAKGFQAGNGINYSYTVSAGVDLTAASRIVITFQNAGAGGLQTTYAITNINAATDQFTVEFANVIGASEGFHWIVF
jgi:hypothetical protein